MASLVPVGNEELTQVTNRELLWTISRAFPMTEDQRSEYMTILEQRKDHLLRIFVDYIVDHFKNGANSDQLRAKITRIQQMAMKAFFEMMEKLQTQAVSRDADNTQIEPVTTTSSDGQMCHIKLLRRHLPDLREQLKLGRTGLMDAMIAENIMTDIDRQQILAVASEPRRNEAFVDFICASLSPSAFKYIFLPLLLKDDMHADIAQKFLPFTEIAGYISERRHCIHCKLQSQNILGKLADVLYERDAISKAVKTDLQKGAMTTGDKWKLLKENVQEGSVFMIALETAYPHIYKTYVNTGQSPLVCCCSCPTKSESRGCNTEITDELRERAHNQTVDMFVGMLRQAGFPPDICIQMRAFLLEVLKKIHEHYMAFLDIVIGSSKSADEVLKKNNYMMDIIITSVRQEMSELSPSQPVHITLDTMRSLRRLLSELSKDLNLETVLVHRMFEKGLMTDSDTDSILAHPTNKDKVESFMEFLTVQHTEESFRAQILPLICEDDVNQHLAQKIQHALDNPADQLPETRCTHCQLVGLGITRRLAQCMLQHEYITEAIRTDLCNPGIPTKTRWQQIREHMNEERMLQVLKETFPTQAGLVRLRNEPLLKCCCDVANIRDVDSTATQPTGNTSVGDSVEEKMRKILGRHFPTCSVSVSRLVEEDRQQIGPEGRTMQSSFNPHVYIQVPPGSLHDTRTVSLHVAHVSTDLLQEDVLVSPLVTLHGLREDHVRISVTLPIPMAPTLLHQSQEHVTKAAFLVRMSNATTDMTCEEVRCYLPCQSLPVAGPGRYMLVIAETRSKAEAMARKIQIHTMERPTTDQFVVSLTTLGHESMPVIAEQCESTSTMNCE